MAKQWASILWQAKPSRAIDNEGGGRDATTHGYIRHEDEGSFLYCTDSFILARIPIRMDCTPDERASVLPEVGIGREGLKALDEGSRFRIADGLLRLDSSEARFPVYDDLKSPDFALLLGRTAEAQKAAGKVQGTSRICFNPAMLQRLVSALGIEQPGVSVENVGLNKAITVKALDGHFGTGLLMPLRSNE